MEVLAELPIPEWVQWADAGKLAQVQYGEVAARAEAWGRRFSVTPAATDARRIALLCVDVQNTFCLDSGELAVKGAVEDCARLCAFLYRNLRHVTQVVATLDTHSAVQIFHPQFWTNASGEAPAPYTQITLDDVRRQAWRPRVEAARHVGWSDEELEAYVVEYLKNLEGRYPLMIWPYHAMLGGVGHALVPKVEEAIFFHSAARRTEPWLEMKGDETLTESYSALRPEAGGMNADLLERLLSFDALVIAGQAKSHCVAWTVADLLTEIQRGDASRAERVYLLEDCTSPVVTPEVDFTAEANAKFAAFAEAGMHIVRSTEPMATWPRLTM